MFSQRLYVNGGGAFREGVHAPGLHPGVCSRGASTGGASQGVVQEGCASGGCIQGGKCIQGVHLGVHPGACIQGVGCRWMYPPEDRRSTGVWYASYWNGYLLPCNKWSKTGMLTISRCHTCIDFWTK